MTTTPSASQPLAILGGVPVRDRYLPYGHQSIDESDIQAVVDVLRSDWLTTGPLVQEFEEAFAASVGAEYAVSLSSGTAALHAAVFAAGRRGNHDSNDVRRDGQLHPVSRSDPSFRGCEAGDVEHRSRAGGTAYYRED